MGNFFLVSTYVVCERIPWGPSVKYFRNVGLEYRQWKFGQILALLVWVGLEYTQPTPPGPRKLKFRHSPTPNRFWGARIWRLIAVSPWIPSGFLGQTISLRFVDFNLFFDPVVQGCARFPEILTFFMWTQRNREFRCHRKWSLNREFEAWKTTEHKLDKVWRSGKRAPVADPREREGGGGEGVAKGPWSLTLKISHKKMVTRFSRIDIMFLGPPPLMAHSHCTGPGMGKWV